MKSFVITFGRLQKSSIFKTIVGFIIFLVVAATLMLILESTETESGIDNFFHSLWFSIVTVTTVGYGDLSPLTSFGKIVAILIMFIGVGYVAVFTGNITSWLVEINRKKVFGLVPVKDIEGHFLVCGWTPGMGELLKQILALHKKDSSFLVLVNNTDAQEVNELKQDPLLRDFHYFNGDYTNTEVLLNVCSNKAQKVLILADERTGRSPEEIDFQTVLAAIAVKSVYPEIYAIAETIQKKFKPYLQNVEVEEIILNRFSARALICNISLMSGINNVFNKLFAMGTGILKIKKTPNDFVGRPYQELKTEMDQFTVLGILENTGNLRVRKHEKILQIQKSMTIQIAIEGLLRIKTMESNIPVFNPPPNYIITENSSLIILDTKPGKPKTKHVKELILDEKSQEKNIHKLILTQMAKIVEHAESWHHFTDLIKNLKMEVFLYQDKMNGVIFREKKYTFKDLNISKNLKNKLDRLYLKKTEKKDWIASRIKDSLEFEDDWSEFFEVLLKERMEIYYYRQKASGIVFEKRKYSFKSLGIFDELITELNKQHEIFHKQSDGGKIKFEESNGKHLSLAEFMAEHRSKKTILKSKTGKESGTLMICGWKPEMIDMLSFIVSQHQHHTVEWDNIVVVAEMDDIAAESFLRHFGDNPSISLVRGDFVDQRVLKSAGILRATKVVILAETNSGKSFEEIDAQTVLAAMLIGNLNKRIYKVAEILDKRYKEALDQANVEEIFLADEFIRLMLANGSHGLGIVKVMGEMNNLEKTVLEITNIEEMYLNKTFEKLQNEFYAPGKMILGLLEETGNNYARKSERIHEAQIQANIKGQVEELKKVKELLHNNVVISPPMEYRIKSNSQLILFKTNVQEYWKNYTLMEA